MTTAATGTAPETSASYTIMGVGGTARNVFPNRTSDKGTWTWTGGFPDFHGLWGNTLTVSFDQAAPLSDLVFGLRSTSLSTYSVALSRRTATAADLNVLDGPDVYTRVAVPGLIRLRRRG